MKSTRIEVALPRAVQAAAEVYDDPTCSIALDGGSLTLSGAMAEHAVWVVRAVQTAMQDRKQASTTQESP